MSTTHPSMLAPREPALAWAARSAAGALSGLDWVDLARDPELPGYVELEGEEGGPSRFRQRVLTRFLPPVYAEEAERAAAEDAVPALDGLHLIFARVEWTIYAIHHLLGPLSPAPALLAALVEPFGVPAALHEGRGDRLARLLALLPHWYPTRGTLARAKALMEACEQPRVQARDQVMDGDMEVFVCHGADWHQDRAAVSGPLEVCAGLLVCARSEVAALAPGDVALAVVAAPEDAATLARLLPAWAGVHSLIFEGEGP